MLETSLVIERELSERGSFAACTSGYSMMPMLGNRRDVVVLEVPKRPILKYDVVLYKDSSGKYILHRIVKVKKNEYIARGDNNYFNERISKDSVLAILTSFNREGKSYSVDEPEYKRYSKRRVQSYPFRRALHITRVGLSKIYHKIFPGK